MNICFLTEGGDKIGLGHISRCLSLADAFNEKNYRCKFIVSGNDSLKKNIRFEAEFRNWIEEKDVLLKSLSVMDVVIIDSYNAPQKLYDEINKIVNLNIYFDDYIRIDYPQGIIINPTTLAKSLDYKVNDNLIYLLGPNYQPLQQPFWDIEPKIKNKQLKNVLITFGGDDSRNLTPQVLKLLNEEFSYLQKIIIIGESFTNTEQIKFQKSNNTELYFSPNANQICELMLNTDVAICGGGQTLYELARLKTPALILGIAKNQENNIKNWQDFPYYGFVGWWNDIDIIGRLRKKLNYFINTFSSIANDIYYDKPIIDGQGSRRIVKEVISHVRKS